MPKYRIHQDIYMPYVQSSCVIEAQNEEEAERLWEEMGKPFDAFEIDNGCRDVLDHDTPVYVEEVKSL